MRGHAGQHDDTPPGHLRLAPGRTIPEGLLSFTFMPSSGPGGQNVNKVSTRCVMRVRLGDLPLSDAQRARLRALAPHLVTQSDELLVTGDEHRSQSQNKAACIERLGDLVRRALVAPKVRRATRPTRGAKERRLSEKKGRGEIKRGRGERHE
jgi:ribosome-associated protein